jgi:adenylosuccinate lyase
MEGVKSGEPNDLVRRLREDPAFASIDLDASLEPSRFCGRAPEQVAAFLARDVEPIRQRYPGARGERREVSV